MARTLAIFGGSFNPPAVHHLDVVEGIAPHFDETLVVPCGPRPDKATTNDIEPAHRAVMADMTFRRAQKVRIDASDLENDTFTRTHELEERHRVVNEVWHVVGTDLIQGGKDGASPIQRCWAKGADLWRSARFAISVREGFPYDPADLPPHHRLFNVSRSGSSTDVRQRVFNRQPIDGLVVPEVAAYVERYNLYRGAVPPRDTWLRLPEPKALIFHDERNPRAAALAERFGGFAVADPADANVVLVIGGDGTMLHAIRKHWRLRLPFFGVNAGHKGYLLNRVSDELQDPQSLFDRLHVFQLPQLRVDYTDFRGTPYATYAFNDAWVERRGGQCAWLKATVDGRVRLPKLVGDGVLVCTAAGSTSYARAMGASPRTPKVQEWLLVGNNVFEPRGWKTAALALSSEVRVESLDYQKRPIVLYVDGVEQGEVPGFRVRPSKVASVELAFLPDHDMEAKLAEDVFPF